MLLVILGLALVLRLAGISYGLPLQLHDDEPPFILAALKMMQLKTVFPVLHSAEFEPILFYLPYASYLYLPFFALYMGGAAVWAFLTGAFPFLELQNYLLSDLSPFFLIARFLSVLAGVLTVYLVYEVGRNLFNKSTGLFSALLLATSLLHITMSMGARHWIWLALSIAAVLAILSNQIWSFRRRYMLAAAVGGIGVGFNIISLFAAPLMFLYYFCFEKRGWRAFLRDKITYAAAAIFIVSAVIPILLYPAGLGFKKDVSVAAAKTLLGATKSFYEFLWPVAVSEPAILIMALFGLVVLIWRRNRFAWLSGLFTVFYILIFYFFFYYAHRFTLGLFPIFAILGGHGLAEIFRYSNIKIFKYMVIVFILASSLVVALRLDYLALRGDSKSLAREWAEENIAAGEKIAVAAKRMRLVTVEAALREQVVIDPSSERKSESAEISFAENPHGYKSFHALNLDAVGNEEFYVELAKYLKKNEYDYLIVTPSDLTAQRFVNFREATRGAELIVFFGLPQEVYSLTKAQYKGWIGNLFKIREFGPPTAIYKLK